MKIDILALFPEMFTGSFDHSIIKRAQTKNLVKIGIHNLHDWAEGSHKTVDDHPFGGGVGMVLKIEPVDKALKALKTDNTKVILTTPQGQTYNQIMARSFSKEEHLLILCGHYEGIDERIREHLIDQEVSIGDFILTGGELPAMVMVDSIVRLLPGVLEKEGATDLESFSEYQIGDKKETLLEYPQYTRPEKYLEWTVPEILMSGNHAKIEEWRLEQALKRTKTRRPDLLSG